MKKLFIGFLWVLLLSGCSSIDTSEKIWMLMTQASNLLDTNSYTGALAVYDQAIETDQYFSEAYAQKWYVYLLQWDMTQWRSHIKQALEINPQSVYGLANMGIAEAMWGRFQASIGLLDQALAIDPTNVHALIYRWNSTADNWNLQEARTFYDQAIALDPENHLVRFNKWTVLADIWFSENDAEVSKQAIDHFAKTLELRPDFSLANIYIWISQYDQQLFEDALSSINKGLLDVSDNETGLYYKWLILSQLERFEDAKAIFKSILATNPWHGYAKAELDKITEEE